MRYQNVSLEEMAALWHTYKDHRDALVQQTRRLSEVMRAKNGKAHRHLHNVERELVLLAGEVEGRAITLYGEEEWERVRQAGRITAD